MSRLVSHARPGPFLENAETGPRARRGPHDPPGPKSVDIFATYLSPQTCPNVYFGWGPDKTYAKPKKKKKKPWDVVRNAPPQQIPLYWSILVLLLQI